MATPSTMKRRSSSTEGCPLPRTCSLLCEYPIFSCFSSRKWAFDMLLDILIIIYIFLYRRHKTFLICLKQFYKYYVSVPARSTETWLQMRSSPPAPGLNALSYWGPVSPARLRLRLLVSELHFNLCSCVICLKLGNVCWFRKYHLKSVAIFKMQSGPKHRSSH